MAIKEVLTLGDPRLYRVAQEVTEFDTEYLDQLIIDMRDTMASLNGAGLAAPQIGVDQRVVIFGAGSNQRYPDAAQVPETVLINPIVNVLNEQVLGMWEGCLSVPGMRGFVERPAHIHYSGVDEKGNQISREARDFHAVVVQHECDHLDGVLYPMVLTDMSRFGFESELLKRPDYPALDH